MSTFNIEPGTFTHLTDDQRRAVQTILKLATARVMDAHALVPKTKNGISAQQRLVDANEMLMDLYGAVREDADTVKSVKGDVYRVSPVTDDGIRYMSVTRWEPQSHAWRMSFSVPFEDGESDSQARSRAITSISLNRQ